MNRRKFFKNLSLASAGVILAPVVIPELVREIPFKYIPHHVPIGWIYGEGVMWNNELVEAEFAMQQQIDRELFKFLSSGQKKLF